jgi:hypothetical protein
MGRNISLGEESEETGGEDVDELSTRSSLIASPATRSTPRSQHKQRVFEELRRERERLARVLMAELERMEHEQKEERPTRVTPLLFPYLPAALASLTLTVFLSTEATATSRELRRCRAQL